MSAASRRFRQHTGTPSEVPKNDDLRVWWIPQLPGPPFHVPVATPAEGAKLLAVLAAYDMFQLRQRIKPDYSNMGGLEVFDNCEWTDWSDEEGGNVDAIEVPDSGFVGREATLLAGWERTRKEGRR